jgi:pyridoxal phosphate enzyme (YggS family)
MVFGSREAVLANLARIREGIARACDRRGRDLATVRLVAASKTVPLEVIGWTWEAGVRDFGENYVKELRVKAQALPDARWHFLGTLQSHTAHHVAAVAAVVHTLAPGGGMAKLARRAAGGGMSMPALIEVDFTRERTGVAPEALEGFAEEVVSTEGLELVGLMTLPPIPEGPEDARPFFSRLRELAGRLRERHPGVVELSMGMSLDYEVAVEEGATMVRIGTALFGERPPAN